MMIVWDEPKRQINLAKHGLDFAALGGAFFEAAIVGPAKDGRLRAIGRVDGVVTVIFATLGTEAISVISMRRASAIERRAYEQAI